MFANFIKVLLLLYIFALLFICCAICNVAFATSASVKLQNTFDNVRYPRLGYVNNTLVIFAQAKCTAGYSNKYDILEGFLEVDNNVSTSNDMPKDIFSKDNYNSSWRKTDLLGRYFSCTDMFSTVFNQTNIYLFFPNYYRINESEWEYKFAQGTLEKTGEKNKIVWKNISSNLKDHFVQNVEGIRHIFPVAGGGSGIVTKNKIIVPVTYGNNSVSYSTLLIMDGDKNTSLTLLPSTIPVNDTCPNVAMLSKDELIMITSSVNGSRKVYKSSFMGNNWTEVNTSFAHVLGNTEGVAQNMCGYHSGFTSAEIVNGTTTILFTKLAKGEGNNYSLHLWMSDSKRVYNVGAISTNVGKNVSSTLLYAEGKLFAAFEKWKNGSSSIYAVSLKRKLETIQKVVNKWGKEDELLSKLYFANNFTIAKNGKCRMENSSDGLIGLLLNNYTNYTWVDEICHVNATVPNKHVNVKRERDGLMFSGVGAGAVWPIGARWQNQWHHPFTNDFTLMATVRIDYCGNAILNSVLGIDLWNSKSNKSSIGLWCKDNKWMFSSGSFIGYSLSTPKVRVMGKPHNVVLSQQNNTFSVYIDGVKLKVLPHKYMVVPRQLNITHFYFGVNADKMMKNRNVSYVSIKNVSLYNRAFTNTAIERPKRPVRSAKNIKKNGKK